MDGIVACRRVEDGRRQLMITEEFVQTVKQEIHCRAAASSIFYNSEEASSDAATLGLNSWLEFDRSA